MAGARSSRAWCPESQQCSWLTIFQSTSQITPDIYLQLQFIYTSICHTQSLIITLVDNQYFRHFHQSLIAEYLKYERDSQVLLRHRSRPDCRSRVTAATVCVLLAPVITSWLVMSPGPRDNHQGWIKRRVYFIKDTRWQPGEARGVDISLLSSWHYDLWSQFMTVTETNFLANQKLFWPPIGQSEASVYIFLCIPERSRQFYAVACPTYELSPVTGQRGTGELWGICFWSFNIPDESHQWLCRHNEWKLKWLKELLFQKGYLVARSEAMVEGLSNLRAIKTKQL